MLDLKQSIGLAIQMVKSYAKMRSDAVMKGKESPYLAALLLQEYGRGVASGVFVLSEHPHDSDPIMDVVNEETLRIDPDWPEHDQERRLGKFANVVWR